MTDSIMRKREREKKTRLMREKNNIKLRREREHWESHKLEEQMRREEEDEKLKQALDERYQRLQGELEEIIREKERTEKERDEDK